MTTKSQPKFLISELVLGQLKNPAELADQIRYWNEEWVSLRQQLKGTAGELRGKLLRAADLAAATAYRLEAVLRDRRQQPEMRLMGALKTAQREFLERPVMMEEAPTAETAEAMQLIEIALQSGARQVEVAEELGVHPAYLNSVLNGHKPWSAKLVGRVLNQYREL